MKTLSVSNILCKYADDTNLLSPANADVGLEAEFSNICHWAIENKMAINRSKTKEIIFHRPNPRNYILPPPIQDVERVCCAKFLGITISDVLKFDEHVKNILSICSQRLYLMKQLKNQGMSLKNLDIVYNALIVSRITYALPAWGGFLSGQLCNSINAFFKKSYKYSLVSKIFSLETLLENADKILFKKSQNQSHCLHTLFPTKNCIPYTLRTRGHQLTLPHVGTNSFKMSYVNRVLFKLV